MIAYIPIITAVVLLGQTQLVDGDWTKTLIQLGVAGAWLWWLTRHLKDQTDRDDKRHAENLSQGKAHALAMERLVLTVYDVLDQLSEEYPHAKQRLREVIRADAAEAIDKLSK